MEKDSRIYVAGHRGLVGSAIVRCLRARGYGRLLLRSRADLDLTDRPRVCSFFKAERPEYVFLAAAKVGGILANDTQPADFIRENLLIGVCTSLPTTPHLVVGRSACRVGVRPSLNRSWAQRSRPVVQAGRRAFPGDESVVD